MKEEMKEEFKEELKEMLWDDWYPYEEVKFENLNELLEEIEEW